MPYHKAIILTWSLALLLTLFLAYDMAHGGEAYLDAGVGASLFQRTVDPGTWYQPPLPNKFDLTGLAWRVQAGYAFNARWSAQAGLVSLGTARVSAKFVDDAEYNPHTQTCFGPTCSNPHTLWAGDDMKAYQLTVKRTFQYGQWGPHLFAGPALLTHRLTVHSRHNDGLVPPAHQHYGRIPAAVLGAGLCYGQGLKACVDVSYYHGFGGQDCLTPCQWPISKQILVPMFSIQLPLF